MVSSPNQLPERMSQISGLCSRSSTNASAIVWLQDSAGIRRGIERWSARCCWVLSMILVLCNMSGYAQASVTRSVGNWQNFSSLIRQMRSRIILGGVGQSEEQEKLSVACQAARADGVKARTCHGNHFDLSWWWEWLTITCKEPASAIRLSFAGGALTRNKATAPMPS